MGLMMKEKKAFTIEVAKHQVPIRKFSECDDQSVMKGFKVLKQIDVLEKERKVIQS
jgi:hypothetical protein